MLHNLSTCQKKNRLVDMGKNKIGYENESKALQHQIPKEKKLKPKERERERAMFGGCWLITEPNLREHGGDKRTYIFTIKE